MKVGSDKEIFISFQPLVCQEKVLVTEQIFGIRISKFWVELNNLHLECNQGCELILHKPQLIVHEGFLKITSHIMFVKCRESRD